MDKYVSWSGLQTELKHLLIADSSSNTTEVGISNICLIIGIAVQWNQEEQRRRGRVLLCLQYVPQILVLVKGTDTRSRSCCRFCCVSFITSCHFQSVGQLRAPGEGHISPLFRRVCVIYTSFVINSKYKIGIMVNLWRDFWIRETGTGQQVAQLRDRHMMTMMVMMIKYPRFLTHHQGWNTTFWQSGKKVVVVTSAAG